MLGNRKIAGHFLFHELTNLWGKKIFIYNVNLYNNFFTILLFILIISSFYHPQAYLLVFLANPGLGITGFALFVFFYS